MATQFCKIFEVEGFQLLYLIVPEYELGTYEVQVMTVQNELTFRISFAFSEYPKAVKWLNNQTHNAAAELFQKSFKSRLK